MVEKRVCVNCGHHYDRHYVIRPGVDVCPTAIYSVTPLTAAEPRGVLGIPTREIKEAAEQLTQTLQEAGPTLAGIPDTLDSVQRLLAVLTATADNLFSLTDRLLADDRIRVEIPLPKGENGHE